VLFSERCVVLCFIAMSCVQRRQLSWGVAIFLLKSWFTFTLTSLRECCRHPSWRISSHMFHPYVFVLRNLVKLKTCLAFSTKFAFLSFSCVLLLNFFIKFGLFPKSLLLHKCSLLKLLCLPSRKIVFESFCFSV